MLQQDLCGGKGGGRALVLILCLYAALAACSEDEPQGVAGSQDAAADLGQALQDAGMDAGRDIGSKRTAKQAAILSIPRSETWELRGLGGEVQVVRTEASVPHIYASTREDLGRVLGFILARDRYFLLDLQRRLALGTISELLGQDALEMDSESRGLGMAFVTELLLEAMDPELGAYLDAVAAGVNAYIYLVAQGELPIPKELELAGLLLGVDSPAELMRPFGRRDFAAMAVVVFYNTEFESEDVGRTASAALLEGLFQGVAYEELRGRGYLEDLWNDLTPLFEQSSAAGFGLERGEDARKPGTAIAARAPGRPEAPPRPSLPTWRPRAMGRPGRVPASLLERAARRIKGFELRLLRNGSAGFGSNAWAVGGSASTDHAALVAGDGHLELSVPSLMYQIALDTRVFGQGDTHQIGLLMGGLPLLAVGTNGLVAWSLVNPVVDVTDWYAEELELDPGGRPVASLFRGEWRPLAAYEESFVVAAVPLLGSEGRTETWTRWVTFDGRWVADIEGRDATAQEELGPDETLVNLKGDLVVPSDTNRDGVISAISFDYVGFDVSGILRALDGFGHARDVLDFREMSKGLVGNGLFAAVGDAAGNILYTSYQGVPCRGYLERDAEGRWAERADPTMLLDGSTYGGFRIPTLDGVVDEEPGIEDPYACVVPFDEMPQALNPARGFVLTANNDPGNIMSDGCLSNDRWYLGGPWYETRADTIARELSRAVEAGAADLREMARIQANADSRLGELFAPALIDAIATARDVASEPEGQIEAHEQRLVELYLPGAAALEEVAHRLEAWGQAGYKTPSGVQTFYHRPTAQDLEDSVATMLFNAWFGRCLRLVFDDEGLHRAWRFHSSLLKVRALRRFLDGRGQDNPLGLASWNPDTGESIFFDLLGTEPVERSQEILLLAMADALADLRSEPTAPDRGGFGSDDMSLWLWGLRHQARFESLLARFLGSDPAFGFLAEQFSITTATLPLAPDLARDDPRRGLTWFPRGGDNWGVDAANPGFGRVDYSHVNGPVMRMVIALDEHGVRGWNIVPGGQSAFPDSPHFADQAALWLANETLPMRFAVSEVVEGAMSRELYHPPR